MPNPNLRTRLIRYAEGQAPAYGVHPTVVPRVVDHVLELHSSVRERRDSSILEAYICDHLQAEPTACSLSAIVRWTGRSSAPELDSRRIWQELSRRGFTHLDDEPSERGVRFTMRSVLTPEEARKKVIETIRQIVGDEAEDPTWLLIDDEVRSTILEPVTA